MQSLHSFCTSHSLPKTSVRRWLNDAGYPTSNGLTDEAIKAALGEFKPSALITAPPTEADPGAMTIHTGNHCTTIDLPNYQGLTIDLGQFRDSSSLVLDDPLAAAEQFLNAADLIQGALATDIAAREQRLQQTKQAQQAVAAKAQKLALEQRLYRLEAKSLDTATTASTTALADALAQLQSLGKPAATEQPST